MAHLSCGYSLENPFDEKDISIRLAKTEDAERITLLSEQLGYPLSQEEVLNNLKAVQQNTNHAIFVAEFTNNRVIGWVHIYVSPLLMYGSTAVLGGLIVEENYRDCGVGRLLMQKAEQWARERGCKMVEASSNVIREGIQIFYERVGYNQVKTSRVFHKLLE